VHSLRHSTWSSPRCQRPGAIDRSSVFTDGRGEEVGKVASLDDSYAEVVAEADAEGPGAVVQRRTRQPHAKTMGALARALGAALHLTAG
jgi:hypothetical protein